MSYQDYKRDERPQRGCWAPGSYCCQCLACGDHFIGDKRAMECADCAYNPNPPKAEFTAHVCEWIIHCFTTQTGPFARPRT